MAHWAELDENNIVIRVLVCDNNDPAGDEGYSWLIENLGGRWLKTSYNTIEGEHRLNGEPFRWNFAGPGFIYFEDIDAFVEPSPHNGWVLNKEIKKWEPPLPKPDAGFWEWDDITETWKEKELE